jgi:hypothetical protein
VLPQRVIDAWNEQIVAGGGEPMDSSQLYVPSGVPDHTVDLEVDASRVVDRVLAAVAEHRTQAGGMDGWSDEEMRAAMSFEYGSVAWPPRPPGSPALTDVFDDLTARSSVGN